MERLSTAPGLVDAGAPDETSLRAAYDLGHEVLASGLGVLELAAMQRDSLARALADRPADPSATVDRAMRLFIESLVPFEMTHRGFRDANQALRASEDRYRDLYENANDMVFTVDLLGQITSINRAGQELTGLTPETARTLNIAAIVGADGARRLLAAGAGAADPAASQRARHELEMTTPAGRRVPLEIRSRVIFENGRPVGLQGIARDITDRKQGESALRHLNQRLEEKAQRIAHALHDEAGQLLASVYLSVDELTSTLPRESRPRLENLRTLLDQVDDQFRRLAHELRPTVLDDFGLLRASEFLAEGVSKRAGLPITVTGTVGSRLPPDVETALYRVLQEAFTNATRHGHPSRISVTFERTPGLLTGSIRDDGTGFDLDAVMARADVRGLGLIGMRERLAAFGGRFSISSSPGRGTLIGFEVPLEA